jgi:hypothetical protein
MYNVGTFLTYYLDFARVGGLLSQGAKGEAVGFRRRLGKIRELGR